jgi:hypothetical protein
MCLPTASGAVGASLLSRAERAPAYDALAISWCFT